MCLNSRCRYPRIFTYHTYLTLLLWSPAPLALYIDLTEPGWLLCVCRIRARLMRCPAILLHTTSRRQGNRDHTARAVHQQPIPNITQQQMLCTTTTKPSPLRFRIQASISHSHVVVDDACIIWRVSNEPKIQIQI